MSRNSVVSSASDVPLRVPRAGDGALALARRRAGREAGRRNRYEEQHADQDAGKLRRQVREPQPVLQDDDPRDAEERARNRAAATRD
jgi:hypothetical protein